MVYYPGAPSYAQPGWKNPYTAKPKKSAASTYKPKKPVVNSSNYGSGAGTGRYARSGATGAAAARSYTPAKPVVNSSNYGWNYNADNDRQADDEALDRQPWYNGGQGGSSGTSSGSGDGGWGGGTGGGTSGGGGGGGGGVPLPVAPPEPPKPIMETIVIPDAKADSEYERTVRSLALAKADFSDQQKLVRDQYDRQFGDAKKRMGYIPRSLATRAGSGDSDETWSLDRDQGAYGEALDNNLNDFAGRGGGFSGVFAKSQSDITRDFTDRLNALLSGRKESVDTQTVAKNAFSKNQTESDKNALERAVARIAAKYQLKLSEVPRGTGERSITREKA